MLGDTITALKPIFVRHLGNAKFKKCEAIMFAREISFFDAVVVL